MPFELYSMLGNVSIVNGENEHARRCSFSYMQSKFKFRRRQELTQVQPRSLGGKSKKVMVKMWLKTDPESKLYLNPHETRAMAWDETERAKYTTRFKQEEVKIQAWESHEKRKPEVGMKEWR
ncbi:remorin 1.4 [Tanacetum coccineum]